MPLLPVVDVTEHRLAGDPDDTASIERAVAFARVEGIGVIYFPAGEYLVGGEPRGALIHAEQGLTFLGEGPCSLLKRVDLALADDFESSSGMLEFSVCQDITIRHLGLDANGLQPGRAAQEGRVQALLSFDACERVWIEDVTVVDSSPRSLGEPEDFLSLEKISHHYDSAQHVAFGFQGGSDIRVIGNRLTGAGIAVHGGAARVRIARNFLESPLGHGIALGSSAPDEGTITDVDIDDNQVIDPLVFGIVAADIPPSPAEGGSMEFAGAGFRGVRIRRNTVWKRDRVLYGRGIVVGRLQTRPLTTSEDPVAPYERFTIAGNLVNVGTALTRDPPAGFPGTFQHESRLVAGTWMQTPNATLEDLDSRDGRPRVAEALQSVPFFEQARITDNQVYGAEYNVVDGDAVAFSLANLVRSQVAGNGTDVSDDGVRLEHAALATHVHDNRALVWRVAYRCVASVESNVFIGNATLNDRLSGSWRNWSRTRWVIEAGMLPVLDGGDDA